MKKCISILAVIFIVAAIGVAGFCVFRSSNPQGSVLSDKYSDKEYIAEVTRVALTDTLMAAVSDGELYMAKLAVLENNISPENEERLVPLIEEYGVANTFMGYSYLNSELVTWDELEAFVKDINKKGVVAAVKEYERGTAKYIPSKFKQSQLEEWIVGKGYPASDIAELDELAQIHGKDFDELMNQYEQGIGIGEIKAGLGLVNTNPETEYVTMDENDIGSLAKKLRIGKDEAESVLASLIRLGFDPEKIADIAASDEYRLIANILQEKYREENEYEK